jgi:hypothetical protein
MGVADLIQTIVKVREQTAAAQLLPSHLQSPLYQYSVLRLASEFMRQSKREGRWKSFVSRWEIISTFTVGALGAHFLSGVASCNAD